MARIELSNIGGGGTTLSLTTTGTSGASTLAGSVLNIPVYQGQLTLTTTGTSGAATLSGTMLNIPNYATGGNPAGSAGQVQFNSTPAGSFAASANLAWDNTAVQLNINAPASPTGKLNVKGSGATSSTVNTRLTDSGNTELLKVLDNGSTNIGANFNWDNVNGRLGLGTLTPNQTLEVSGAMRLTGTAGTAAFMLGRNSAGDVSTVTLGTTGTSGAATLSANVLNIPQYQGAVSLTTSGTSGASTFAANVLNIPQYQGALTLSTAGTTGASTLVGNTLTIPTYQGQLTLTTTGTSGAATLVGNTLNIPQYSGGGGTPAGATGEIQYNNAGAFAASANLAWDNAAVQLNIGAPSVPTGKLNVKGGGTTSTTVNLRLTDSGNTELLKVLDSGSTNIGTGFNWDNANVRLGIGISSPTSTLQVRGANALTSSSSFILQSTSTTILDVRNDGRFIVGDIIIEPSTSFSFLRFKGNGSRYYDFGMSESNSSTSGTSSFVINTKGFNPSSGSAVFNGYTYEGVINQTGTASGVARGLYIQPTLTSAPDWRSIEWSNNSGYGIYGAGSAINYLAGNTVIGTTTPSARLHIRGSNPSSGTNAFLVQNSTPSDIYKIENDGKISYLATNTAAGTTGAQTINRPSGTVNFAAGASALVVTNSLCTTASLVFAEVRTNDATAQIKNVVPAAGSFTINLSAAATAETSVGFLIIN